MVIVPLWCSAARSAFFCPLILVLFCVGGLHDQYRSPTVFPRRDEGFSAAPNPVSCFHPTPHRPGLVPGFSTGWSGRSTLVPARCPRRRTPPHAKSATRIHARAARGAEQSRKLLVGEPGGLRYPRAELVKTRTSRSRASRLSTKF